MNRTELDALRRELRWVAEWLHVHADTADCDVEREAVLETVGRLECVERRLRKLAEQ